MKPVIFVCYNVAMRRFGHVALGSLLVVFSGCATTADQADSSQLSFAQVKAEPNSFYAQPVTFGGKVLGAKRLKEGTRIEILQLPLNASLQPTNDLSTSQGRFVALRKEFLDPATVPPGTFITVTGEIGESLSLPLDETEYTYPLVHIKNLRVWSDQDEQAPRIRPPIGPGPYWGPYWSPYWHPWPYYW